MKKILSVILTLALVALFIPALAEVTPELTLTIASNATDPTNPYSYGLDKFKEVAEEVSGGKIPWAKTSPSWLKSSPWARLTWSSPLPDS